MWPPTMYLDQGEDLSWWRRSNPRSHPPGSQWLAHLGKEDWPERLLNTPEDKPERKAELVTAKYDRGTEQVNPDQHHHRHHHLFGYQASHHDKIPPWLRNVSDYESGNMSVSKIHHTPYTMLNYFLKYIYMYMSHCQSIVTKLMKFPTLLITTQNLDFLTRWVDNDVRQSNHAKNVFPHSLQCWTCTVELSLSS